MADDTKYGLHRLEAYQRARELRRKVRALITEFPRGHSNLVDQMTRAARGACVNIGEGVGKRAN